MKNTNARIIIQVNAWPPPWATLATVSTPTSADQEEQDVQAAEMAL
ncbi:MAG TPA: hypothetical protein VGG35_05050 [Streptosporangiaceae bacterium]|jgi:hypothetical protein